MKRSFITVLAVVGVVVLAGLATLAFQQTKRAPAAPVPAEPVASGPVFNLIPGPDAVHVRFVKTLKPVPACSVTTFDGRTFSPASLRGKVAIVNFWATWCGPCRLEIPSFIELQKKYGNDLVILGLSVDDVGEDVVRRFVTEHTMNYPVAMASNKLQEDFGGVGSLPTSFVLDRNGNVEQKHIGLYSADEYELELRALAGMPVKAVVDRADDDEQISVEHAAEANAIPGVDLSKLTPDQKAAVLTRLNAEHCTCGCNRTVARCRIDDPSCETSLPLAKKIIDDLTKKTGRGK